MQAVDFKGLPCAPPVKQRIPNDGKMFVRDIVCVRDVKYRSDFIMFGSFANGQSVAVKVVGFRPFFFLSIPDDFDLSKTQDWVLSLNEHPKLNKYEYKNFNCVESVVPQRKSRLIGYHPKPLTVFKLTYSNPVYRKALVKLFKTEHVHYPKEVKKTQMETKQQENTKEEEQNNKEEDVHYTISPLLKMFLDNEKPKPRPPNFVLYNEDWDPQCLLMHATKIKLWSWISLKGMWKSSTITTNTHHEYYVKSKKISLHPDQSQQPATMVGSIRALAKSSMALNMMPQPEHGDPLTFISLQLYRLTASDQVTTISFENTDKNQASTTDTSLKAAIRLLAEIKSPPVQWQVNVSCGPKIETEEGRVTYRGSEKAILLKFSAILIQFQVDVMMFLSDNFHCLQYMARRATVLGLANTFSLSRIRHAGFNLFSIRNEGKVFFLEHPGRDRLDIADVLKKDVKHNLDDYTLLTAIQHPELMSETPPASILQHKFLTNTGEETALENNYLRLLAQESNTILNFSGFSKETFCNLTDVSHRGQQIRVFRTIISHFHARNIIVNREQLDVPPLIINLPASQSSYPPPPIVPNEPFNPKRRKMMGLPPKPYPQPFEFPNTPQEFKIRGSTSSTASGSSKLGKRKQATSSTASGNSNHSDHSGSLLGKRNRPQLDLFGNVVKTKKQRKEEKHAKLRAKAAAKKQFTGGAVAKPFDGFFLGPTAVNDFASLYPSVNISECFCFSNVVYDRRLMNDPTIRCITVPINASSNECAVFVSHVLNLKTGKFEPVPTVMPDIVSEVMMIRKRAKKEMKKHPKGSFQYLVWYALQASCKVFQNSVYGFYSVEKNAMLALPLISAAICAVGRWMIHKAKYILISKFKGFCCYGDTDSLMFQLPLPPHLWKDRVRARAYYFFVLKEIEKHFDSVFKKPHKFEFEKLFLKYWLSSKKKNYAALVLGCDDDINKEPEMDVKGLMFTKRCSGKLLQFTGNKLMRMMLEMTPTDQLVAFIETQIQKIVSGEASYADLCVSCLIQDRKSYKSTSLVQLTVVDGIEASTGRTIPAGERISYVLRRRPLDKPEMKDYELGVDTSEAIAKQLPLNKSHYLKQFQNTIIKPLLVFHPGTRRKLNQRMKNYADQIAREESQMMSLV